MSMTSHTRPCRSCTSCRPTLKTNPYWIDSMISPYQVDTLYH
jgi:hypothetical protein